MYSNEIKSEGSVLFIKSNCVIWEREIMYKKLFVASLLALVSLSFLGDYSQAQFRKNNSNNQTVSDRIDPKKELWKRIIIDQHVLIEIASKYWNKPNPNAGLGQSSSTIKAEPFKIPPPPPPLPNLKICSGNVPPVAEMDCPAKIEMGPGKPYGQAYNAFALGHQNCVLEVESLWEQGDISIITGNRGDTVTALESQTTHYFINTCEGNDTVTTGLGNNTIYTAEGNDTVNTAGGTDTIVLGQGNDKAYTKDNLQDTIFADADDEVLEIDGIDLLFF